MRTPLLVGNWKMNTLAAEGAVLAADLLQRLKGLQNIDLVVAPPFTSLDAVGRVLKGTTLRLAAQDLHWEDRGAYTGCISHSMLEHLGCTYVLVGHSERRKLCTETDHLVNRKIHAALRGGLRPILCVGEEQSERDSGRYREVLLRQLDRALEDIPAESAARIAVAYEPVWAIGTGRAARVEDAVEAHRVVRHQLELLFGTRAAQEMRILYGGSITAANVARYASDPQVDGVLVGGASLNAEEFAAIARSGW